VGAPAADWLGELPWPAAGAPPAALRACLELGERRSATTDELRGRLAEVVTSDSDFDEVGPPRAESLRLLAAAETAADLVAAARRICAKTSS
ncbi:MAG: hypothetical protein NZL88_11205, partial [Gaiellaceae bacterium]|nr:hypothetical protein [Gaiellaceae bacterium]